MQFGTLTLYRVSYNVLFSCDTTIYSFNICKKTCVRFHTDQCGYGDIIDDSEWRQKAVKMEEDAGSEDEETATIKKFKSLVQNLHSNKDSKRAKDFEMEVTWEPGMC